MREVGKNSKCVYVHCKIKKEEDIKRNTKFDRKGGNKRMFHALNEQE